jgi:hypothetical protein
MSGHAEASAMLSSISRAVFGHELTAPAGKDGLSFTVDGVWIEAVATGPRAIRLKCTILSELPDREGELRRLMAQYLRYTDTGKDVLCTDSEGRLLLIAEVRPEDELQASVVNFCDAAVHWTKMAARRRETFQPMRGPMMIFP